MNHSLYQDGILKALPFKRLPWFHSVETLEVYHPADMLNGMAHNMAEPSCSFLIIEAAQTDLVIIWRSRRRQLHIPHGGIITCFHHLAL